MMPGLFFVRLREAPAHQGDDMPKSLLIALAISLASISTSAFAQKKSQVSCEQACNKRCSVVGGGGAAAGNCTAQCIPACYQQRSKK
jgi:hypothetical protein